MAKLEIDKIHPIDKSHWDEAFPWLCCICGSVRKRRAEALKESMIASGLLSAKTMMPERKPYMGGDSLYWQGLDVLNENGDRKSLPNELQRLDEMREREKDRKKELDKDKDYFGDPF
jgi:hypothetical protein